MNQALKSALSNFSFRNGELIAGGVPLASLAEEHGTPVYIYDTDIIRKKCQALRDHLPRNLKIYFAVKANPHAEVIRLLGDLCDGFDVASSGEAERVIQAGIDPEKISFAGPGKTLAELRYSIDEKIGALSIESEREFDHIRTICKRHQKTANVIVRVNPDFDLSQSGMKMGGGPKQFGVDSERVPALIKAIKKEKSVLCNAIHIYAGSQNLSADQLLEQFEKILEYSASLVAQTGIHLTHLNMGGGFGIPYFAHDQELDLASVGQGLEKQLNRYGSKLGNTSFIIELGRYLVGESGIYMAKILYKKISKGQMFLVTDGGMHHHLAASGNFGQSLVRRPMPITLANRQDERTEKVHVTGPLCTPLDTFGYVELPRAQEGDLVCVLNSGAYGFSASPIGFLSHPPPKEVIV